MRTSKLIEILEEAGYMLNNLEMNMEGNLPEIKLTIIEVTSDPKKYKDDK